MEKRLNKKLEAWITELKDNIINEVVNIDFSNIEKTNKLRQFIYDQERLCFTKDDFQKRKRIKNVVPFFDRCCAKRATNEQCTRRKKDKGEYCGTHMKGTPHGIIDNQDEVKPITQKIEVWAQEILGKSPMSIRMLKFAMNLTDDGMVGQQVFAGEATRLAYMSEEAVEGRNAFLEKRKPNFEKKYIP